MKTLIVLSVLCSLAVAFNTPTVNLPKGPRPPVWEPRIVGGSNAQLGEFPFQVSLRHVENGRHTCGGSIISPNYVITAAHCVTDNGVLYIVAGTVTLDEGGTRYDVAEVLKHEDYDPDNMWANDIALLRTATPIQFTNYVQQALLPRVDTPGAALVNVSGWGKLSSSDTEVPNRLQKINNWPIMANMLCSIYTGYNVYDGQLCAGGSSGSGICQGDSGGPISQNGAVHGLASFVYLPCGSGEPDVFTRVFHYVDWINAQMKEDAHTLRYLD